MREENLIREFIAEAEEHVFMLEPNLLRLEKERNNAELVNEIFLATHSIKGTASYVGLSHISSFTHILESLLDRVRHNTLPVSSELIDELLQGVDALKSLIQHVSAGQSAPDVSAVIHQLETWQEQSQTLIVPVEAPENNPSQGNHMLIADDDEVFTFQLDPEDAEIFVDITRQQLELMRFSLGKIRDVFSHEHTDAAQAQIDELLTSLITAFRKIQSSAALFDAQELDALLERYRQQLFDRLEAPLVEEDLKDIDAALLRLELLSNRLAGEVPDEAVPENQPEPAQEAEPAQSPECPIQPAPQSQIQGNASIASFEGNQGQHTLRVDAERIDHLLNLVGELVINRAQLSQIGQDVRAIYEELKTGTGRFTSHSGPQKKKDLRAFKKLKENFEQVSLNLGRLTNQMQEGTMRIRMVPIGQVVNRFPRMVRDLCRQAGKEVEVRMYGADTELDKTVIDVLADPLIHIIRNAVDHGIEMPEERERQGKPRAGSLSVSAYHEGNQVTIEIQDDGKGIDTELVKRQAQQQQLITPQEAEQLSSRDINHLIFHTGLSTVKTVSSLSGRGVGLNLVRRYLEKISGSIELETSPGKGCLFTITLPLTLAIIPALMVKVRAEIFAIPLMSVEEAIRIVPQDIKTIESHQVFRLRERTIPLFELAELFGNAFLPESKDDKDDEETYDELREYVYCVVISDGLREIGVIVDRLLGENDTVIKSLRDDLVNVEGISGASIRGDGRVSLVIDTASLINLAIKHLRKNHQARAAHAAAS